MYTTHVSNQYRVSPNWFLNASSQRNMDECTYKYLLFNLLSRVGPGLIHHFGEGGGGGGYGVNE